MLSVFSVGMKNELEKVVQHKHTAKHVGSGGIDVLATPVMITWAEEACYMLLHDRMPEGFDTVGISISVSHFSPTPIDMSVRVIAEIVEIQEKIITFNVKIYDEIDKIGQGTHKRASIETKPFFKKAKEKAKS